jgi:hypothetical protein
MVARADLRPWVMYNGFQAEEFPVGEIDGRKVGKGISASLSFVNSGKIPAAKVSVFSAMRVSGFADPPPVFEPRPEPGKELTMGPNWPTNAMPCAISDDDRANFVARRSCWWLYAYASYEDPVHEGEPHETEVTARLTCTGLDKSPDGSEHPRIAAMVEGPQNRMT